jgi:two-component system cell cycle response regulator DivK
MSALRVLVVDDNFMNLEMASFVLSADAIEVETAADAQAALAKIATFKPALILMDIQMPGMDGVTLMRRLKADATTQAIVIIAFTAYAMKGDAVKLTAAGCDGYISKPIDVSTFAAQVRAYGGPPADVNRV